MPVNYENGTVLDIEHDWGELDKDAPHTSDATARLAACNMDWDRIRAVDILMLLDSFKPERGVIHSVTVLLGYSFYAVLNLFIYCSLLIDNLCKHRTWYYSIVSLAMWNC